MLIVLGGSSDSAYSNGKRDFDEISAQGVPVLLFSKNIGHGGDLFQPGGGDFTAINLAWLNWWLKGDEGASGKGALLGAGCTYCSDNAWEVAEANVPWDSRGKPGARAGCCERGIFCVPATPRAGLPRNSATGTGT